MEKLQKALQRARDQRSAVSATSSMPTPTSHRIDEATEKPTGLEALWENLRVHEPDPKALEKNRLMSLSANHSATPFDILRTKTQLMMKKNGWMRLGITSATQACGKTTLACNLALGLTRQRDVRVIMVELDLRRPNIAQVLQISPQADVTSMLSGEVAFADQAVRLGSNVAVSTAMRPAADPTSILLSQKAHATLAEIETAYAPDLVIFDLPPILVGDDTRAFLKEVDCAILVAKAETTSVAQIDRCEREIAEHSNVLGVVLNQCRYAEDEGYYGYYDS